MKNEKLRQALSFHTLLVGGNPMTTSAIYALIHKLERDGGVWFAKGGTNGLVAGMVAHFERLGGDVRLGDPVRAIETLGDRATGVATAERLARRGRRGRVQRRRRAHVSRPARRLAQRAADRGRARAEALFAVAVRRPFRRQGHMAGHPAPQDPVRPAL